MFWHLIAPWTGSHHRRRKHQRPRQGGELQRRPRRGLHVECLEVRNLLAGLVITETGGLTSVFEGGATDTVDIGLDSIPIADVHITVTADSQTEVSLDGISFSSSVMFSRADTTSQTVTVRAFDDVYIEASHAGTISIEVDTTDADYAALPPAPDIFVTVGDDDASGHIFTLALANNFPNATLQLESPTTARVFDTDDPGNPAHQYSLTDVDFLIVNGSREDNHLTIDYSNGDPLGAFAGGVGFNGGAAAEGGDLLAIIGSGKENAVYTPSARTGSQGRDGVITVGASTLTFTGLEPIDIFGMASAALITPPDGNDTLTLTSGSGFLLPGTAIQVSGTVGDSSVGAMDGVQFEPVAFGGNGEVIIDTSHADIATGARDDDRVIIASADNNHNNMKLTIITGGGDDDVDVNGVVMLAGPGSSLQIQSQDIMLGSQIFATDLVMLDAGTGSIVDDSPGEAPNISGMTAVLRAANGIGDNDDIDTAISTLAADNSAAGSIQISNDRPLVVGNVAGLPGVRGSVNIAALGTITVDAAATVLANGTIGGTLEVRGTIAPGPGPGVLSTDNVDFQSNSRFEVEIGGKTPGQGAGFHDVFGVAGAVVIGSNVTLATSPFGDGAGAIFVPADGDQFVIIDNGGADPVTGTFGGLPEGALVNSDFLGSGLNAYVTYAGGTNNNDVVILVDDVPVISGTVTGQPVDDNATITPFSQVTITDASPMLTVTARLSNGDANGVLTNLGGFIQTGPGVYALAGATAAAAETAIRAIVFDPTENQVPPGQLVTTTVTIEVDDGRNPLVSDNGTSMIANPINDAPVLTATGSQMLTGTDEDTISPGDQVSAIVAATISDVDAGAVEGIAINFTSGSGTWEFSTDGGETFSPIGSVSTAEALLLRASDLLRYVPDGALGETAIIGYRAWDQTGSTFGQQGLKIDVTSSGGTTPFSTAVDMASLVVADVNDAPVLTVDSSGAVVEDQSDPTLSVSGALSFTDADATDADTTDMHTVSTSYKSDASWSGGMLTASQITAFSSGFSADTDSWDYSLANSAAQFLAAGETITLSFDVTVTDDSGAANASDTETVTITIQGVNDAPVLNSVATFLLQPVAVTETNGTGTLVSEIVASGGADPITDPDANAMLGIAVTGVEGSGTWQYSIAGQTGFMEFGAALPTAARLLRGIDRIRYVPDPQLDGTSSASPALTFQAWDRTSGAAGGVGDATVSGGTTTFSLLAQTAAVQVFRTAVSRGLGDAATVISDIVPNGKNDRLTLTIRGTDLVVTDDASLVGDALGNQAGNEVVIPLAAIGPNLDINLQEGQDGLLIDFSGAPQDFNLTVAINGGQGADTLTFQGTNVLGTGNLTAVDGIEDIFVNGTIATQDGTVTLRALQSLEVNAAINTGMAGEFHLAAGHDVFGNCSVIRGATGTVEGMTGIGGVRIVVDGAATMHSEFGGIAGCDGQLTVTATTAKLDAKTGIGSALVTRGAITSPNPLRTMIGTLDANAGGVGIFIRNEGPITITRGVASREYPFGIVDIGAIGSLTVAGGPDAVGIVGKSIFLAAENSLGATNHLDMPALPPYSTISVPPGTTLLGPPDPTTAAPEGEALRWHNPMNPLDVDDDGYVSALDVLKIVNHVNTFGSQVLAEGESAVGEVRRYVDVNGDGLATPQDALRVINYLNRAGDGEGEDRRSQAVDSSLQREGILVLSVLAARPLEAASSFEFRGVAPATAPAGRHGSSSATPVPVNMPVTMSAAIPASRSRQPIGQMPQPRLLRPGLTGVWELEVAGTLDGELEMVLSSIAEDVLGAGQPADA